jgi:dihydrofolate reductase
MRKVIVSEFVTLDGVMEAPDKWSFQFMNEETAKYKFDELFASDALLLGRVTYQIFADAWPSLTDEESMLRIKEAGGDTEALRGDMGKGNPFADRMNSIQKFVVSTTLKEVKWNNSMLIKGNIAQEVSKLKQQPGQDILIEAVAIL